MVTTREQLKNLYKDLEEFKKLLMDSPVICKIVARELLNLIDEVRGYDEEWLKKNHKNIELLKSVYHNGNNLKEFVEMLSVELIGYLNDNAYTLYSYWGCLIQFTLKNDWLGINLRGYATSVTLKGVKVKAVKGRLATRGEIKSIEDIDNIPNSWLEEYNDWIELDLTKE